MNQESVIDRANLSQHAKAIREMALTMSYESKTSHIGCALSFADILATLYFGGLHLDPAHPTAPDRDRVILSKGHAVVGLYAALAERGFFPKEKLSEYCRDGSRLASHIVRGVVPGAETSGGSGGHGLPIAVGMAVAFRNKKLPSRAVVLSGDGELEEGSVWEATLFAGYHKLSNILLIIDRNNFQDGTSGSRLDQILDLEPLDEKFKAFGWDASTVDGHDFEDLSSAIKTRSDKPRVIIAKTIKGKGVPFMEHEGVWHNKALNEEQYRSAIQQLT